MKQTFKIVTLCSLIVAILAACAGTPTPAPVGTPSFPDSPGPIPDTSLAELEVYIIDAMEYARIPGASVVIVQDGQVIYAQGFGVRTIGETDPVTTGTAMRIGSSSKSFTTMMMATVVDDGLMSWDTPVTEIYPSFALSDPARTELVTMHHTVCACTGVPRFDVALLFGNGQATPEYMIRSLQEIPLVAEFEQEFQYSNQMVSAGGYIAAVAGGGNAADLETAFRQEMQRRVFGPIDMPGTGFAPHPGDDHASPHALTLEGEFQSFDPAIEDAHLAVSSPAGGIWSTADDMGRYLVTVLNQGVGPDGNRVVSSENLTFTWQPQVAMGDDNSYALGWMVREYQGLPLIHHGGNTLGYSTDIAFMPTAGLGIAVLTNAESAGSFTETIRYRFLEIAFGLPNRYDPVFQVRTGDFYGRLADIPMTLETQVDPEAVAPYLGSYTDGWLGNFTLRMDESRLLLDTGAYSAELLPVSGRENIYYLYGIPYQVFAETFRFEMDENGIPQLLFPATNPSIVFIREVAP